MTGTRLQPPLFHSAAETKQAGVWSEGLPLLVFFAARSQRRTMTGTLRPHGYHVAAEIKQPRMHSEGLEPASPSPAPRAPGNEQYPIY
jgi:hypothetical protein